MENCNAGAFDDHTGKDKDNYADHSQANSDYTISILSHIPITECSNIKKRKAHLRIYETILPFGEVFKGMLWYLRAVPLIYFRVLFPVCL